VGSKERVSSMKIGLVGFAGSGKTTVFNSMTGLEAAVGFGGEVRMGTVKVPDNRIDRLSAVYSPRRTTFAEMSFCDVPGEYGAEKKGLSSRTLQQIRDQDALCLVVRDFPNPVLDADPDPVAELNAFHTECVLADLEIVERRLERSRKERAPAQEIAVFEKAQATLEEERPLRSLPETELSQQSIRGFGLLTDRPLLVAVNREEERATEDLPPALARRLQDLNAAGLSLSAGVEADLASMEAYERDAFLADMGLAEPALDRFIRTAYDLVDLISFFTVGPDEVRAWTIRRGTNARKAAGKIHSDLERGFIRAEVIPYQVFIRLGSEQAVKDAGLLQVQGKEYVVSDGDLMNIRFNV
jgi:ribosome-binding ATPase